MNKTLAHLTLTAIAAAIAAPNLAAQTTVSITSDIDNTLYESPGGALSNGQGFLFVGLTGGGETRRTLVLFDVAANVPAGATIISANLDLFVAQQVAFATADTDVHRLSQAFGEGSSLAPGNGGGGTAATTGDATWIHSYFPGTFWNNPGGDFDPTPSFTFVLPQTPGAVQTPAFPGLIADAQSWLDNPAQNFGWLIKNQDELLASNARRINSGESALNPPTLNITYLLQGETASIGIGCPVGAGTYNLDLVGPATGGTIMPLTHSNAPASSIGINFFSLGLDPIGTPLFSGCTAYLPLALEIIGGNLFVTDATGLGNSDVLLPAGFPGFLVAVQGATLDATPLGVSLSNGGVMILQ